MVNTKQKDEIEFAAFMGIDWADQTHAWALELPTDCDVEHGDLAHTPEALEAWAAELAHRPRWQLRRHQRTFQTCPAG